MKNILIIADGILAKYFLETIIELKTLKAQIYDNKLQGYYNKPKAKRREYNNSKIWSNKLWKIKAWYTWKIWYFYGYNGWKNWYF